MTVTTLPLRIAVGGAGTIGLAHIAVIQQNTRCTVSAIVDSSESAVAVAAAHGVPLYQTLDALLADDKPDGIILATPNALHVPQALQCIAAGVPILLEKPIATTVQEAHTLVDKVEATGRKC